MKTFICYLIVFYGTAFFLANLIFIFKRIGIFNLFISKINNATQNKNVLKKYFNDFMESKTLLVLLKKASIRAIFTNLILLAILLISFYFIDLDSFLAGIITGFILSFFQYKSLCDKMPFDDITKGLFNDLPIFKHEDFKQAFIDSLLLGKHYNG